MEEAPAGGRDVLFPAWRLFFERIAERGTTVLVFEDLQWADTRPARLHRPPARLVEGPADPGRHAWPGPSCSTGGRTGAPDRRNLTALALEPLTDDAMRELLNGLVPGLPEEALAAIVGRAEGMPLYAVETVRGLLADGRIERDGDLYEPVGDLANSPCPDRCAR